MCDLCPLVADPEQFDLNGNGIGDARDVSLVPDYDGDGDGVADDGDGSGIAVDNVCDVGGASIVCDDNCPPVQNNSQADSD